MKKKKRTIFLIAAGIITLLFILLIIVLSVIPSEENNSKYQTYKVKNDDSLKISGKANPKSVKNYTSTSDSFGVMISDNEQVKTGTQLINLNPSPERQNIVNQLSEIQTKINDDYNKLNISPNDSTILNDLSMNQKKITSLETELNKHDSERYEKTHATFDGKVKVLNKDSLNDKKATVKLISNETNIETLVSEYDLEKIKEGDSVNIKITTNGKVGKGKITYISSLPEGLDDSPGDSKESNNSFENASATNNSVSRYKIIISDLNIPVHPGYTIEGEIPIDNIKLPKNVLVRDSYVFVLNSKNRVERRNIKFEKINGEIILKKGLKKGETLIQNPKSSLNDGDKVEVTL